MNRWKACDGKSFENVAEATDFLTRESSTRAKPPSRRPQQSCETAVARARTALDPPDEADHSNDAVRDALLDVCGSAETLLEAVEPAAA